MATLEVEIDGRGARRGARTVTRSLDDIRRKTNDTSTAFTRQQKSVDSTQQSLRALGQAFTLLAAGFTVQRIIATADAYTQLNNRLKLVTDSTEELTAVSEELFAVSQNARVSFESTAELYQRVARSSDQLGKSTQEVLDVTDAVSKAITISGVSAEAANAAIVQLGQGLASGALRGDELRSVLEQTPRLARAIADGLDIPIGKLRELGAEGELTADRVFTALQDQAAVLNAEFGQLNATVGQSLTVLGNSFTRLIGRLDQTINVSGGLSQAFLGVSGSIDENIAGIEELTFAFTQFVTAGTLSLTTIDNRFDQFANSVRGTIALIFGDESLADQLSQERLQIERELELERSQIADFLDDEREAFEERRRVFEEASELDLTAAPSPVATIDPDAAEEAKKLAEELDKLAEAVIRQVDPLVTYEETLSQLDELLLTDRISQEQYNAALNAASEAYRGATPEGQAYNDMLSDAAQITESVLLPTEEYGQEVARLGLLLQEGLITQETFNRAVAEAQDRLREATNESSELANFLEEASVQAARNIQSSFADFLFDPFDQGLEGLVSNFADALRRMAAEALSQQILQGIFGAATGGAGGGGGGGGGLLSAIAGAFTSRQTGGPLMAGQGSIVNERGVEAFVPREAGQVISNRELRQGAAGAAPEVNVDNQIVNVVDPSGIVAAMESAQGQKAILNVIQLNPDSVRRALS